MCVPMRPVSSRLRFGVGERVAVAVEDATDEFSVSRNLRLEPQMRPPAELLTRPGRI